MAVWPVYVDIMHNNVNGIRSKNKRCYTINGFDVARSPIFILLYLYACVCVFINICVYV